MSHLDAIKARLGSISHGKVRLIASVSPAAHRLLFEDLPKLIAIAEYVPDVPDICWCQLQGPFEDTALGKAVAALEEK